MSTAPATIELDALHHDAAPDAGRDTAVRLSLIHRIMGNHRTLPLLFPAIAALVLASLESSAPVPVLFLWGAAVAAIWIEYAIFSRRYFRGSLAQDPDALERGLSLRYWTANLVWSGVLVMFWSPGNDPQNFFLVLLFVSHLAVATATTAYNNPIYLACTVPVALPIAAAAIAAGTTVYLSVALLTLMAYAFMLSTSRQMRTQSAAAVGLRLDHDTLIRDLAAAKVQSDRALAETELANRQFAASEKRFRTLVDNAFDGVATTDDRGVITFATDAVGRIFDLEGEELRGRQVATLAANTGPVFIDRLLQRLDTAPDPTGHLEGWRTTAAGRRVFIEASVRRMRGDPAFDGFVINVRDLTDRRRAIEELRMHLHVLEVLAGGGDIATVLGELAGQMEVLHPEARTSIFMASETGGLRLVAAPSMPALYRDSFAATIVDPDTGPCGIAAASGECVIIDDVTSHPLCRGKLSQAEEFGIGAVWSHPIVNSTGAVLGAVAMIYSSARAPRAAELAFLRGAAQIAAVAIERRRAEQRLADALRTAEIANHSKTQFLANMSHELRTPLNAIIGFSEIIREEMFGPIGSAEYADYIQDIHSSGHHLLSLINDILDISKIEAGHMELEEDWIDPVAVISWSCDLVRERARQGKVAVGCTSLEGLPQVLADERALRQILLNLISNAVKFTPAGGTVTVSAHAGPEGYGFRIEDTGIGIEPHMIERVLEPFAQAEGPLARTYGGTGLGLPITKALAELHGGSLKIESVPGEGTAVTVTLPAANIRQADTATADLR